MTFTFDKAKKIVAHYHFLVGHNLDLTNSEIKITHLLIEPSDKEQSKLFMSYFKDLNDNETALLKSGFDKNQVSVKVIAFYNDATFYTTLDKYLTKANIEKVYLNEDF